MQQLYTVVDSVIVGRSVGNAGLAAIGASGAVVSFLSFIVFGVGIGTTVLLSKYSGAGQDERYRRAAATTLSCSLALAVLMALLCLLLPRTILTLFRVRGELVADGARYLRIMGVGLLFSALYNFYNALLLSRGNSKIPFAALLSATVCNIALTWLLTKRLGMGVAGAAVGSAASQLLSAAICAVYTVKRWPSLFFRLKDLRVEKKYLRETLKYGGGSALQQLLFHGGKLLVQGAVNVLAIEVVAGYGVAVQIEAFILSSLEGVATSTSRCCSKRFGENDRRGAAEAFLGGTVVSVICAAVVAAAIYLLSPAVVSLFSAKNAQNELASAVLYLRTMSLCYMALSLAQILQALMRGLGKMDAAIAATVLQMIFRVGVTYTFIYKTGLTAICVGTLAGWLAMTVFDGWLALKWMRGVLTNR